MHIEHPKMQKIASSLIVRDRVLVFVQNPSYVTETPPGFDDWGPPSEGIKVVQDLVDGMEVEGYFLDREDVQGEGKWYPGKVVRYNKEDACWVVKFDDGEEG